MHRTKKELVTDILKDSVSDLLYYDRKEDEDMSKDDIQKVFDERLMTIDEAVYIFRTELINGLKH